MMTRIDKGFTLIEVIVGMAVLMIFFGSVAVIMQISLRTVGESRVRVVAANLAQERLELARNLPYLDVGTLGGIPSGTLLQQDQVEINGQTFTIYTNIVYIDSPYDGLAPLDPIPTDYKQVRVAVDWDGVFAPARPLVVITDIAPRGLESAMGTGTISILVFNSQGDPVSNAQVMIKAEDVTPEVDLTTYSDNFGRVILPGAPTCIECYLITVSKTGHTTDRTYGVDEVTNPNKPHMSVFEGQLSQISFAIDTVSPVTFRAVRQDYSSFQGVLMRVHGTKEIGRTDQDDPVYKFDGSITTGSGGQVVVNDLEWDLYTVIIPAGSSVDFAGSWPYSPFIVQPGVNGAFTTVVRAQSPHTLLVIAQNQEAQPVVPAQMELKHLASSFIATVSAGAIDRPDRGQAFFTGLNPLNYQLSIFADGYQTATASVQVSGDAVEKFSLIPQE